MKRIGTVFLALALLAMVLAGCAPAAEEAPATEAPATEAPATEAPATEAPAEEVTIRVGAMTGPTGIGMVKLLEAGMDDSGLARYEPTIAGSADEITPLLIQGELDIAAVPSNLAAVLYNRTEGQIQMLAANTLGVLYILEYGGEEIQSFADLAGHTIYATGKGSTPEYFLRYLLTENGLDPDADVTLEWKSEPGEIVALLGTVDQAVVMLPQPYVTAAMNTVGEGLRLALSLSDGWDALDNGSRCVTAGLVVRREFAQEHPEALEQFLADYAASTAWVNENPAEAGVLCGQFNIVQAAVAEKAIPYCNIVCITGSDMKEAVTGCLEVLWQLNHASVGDAMPGDDFWYGA